MTSQELSIEPSSEPRPPNLKEAMDYNKEPSASRCFNCAFLREENLSFYCSKFMVKIKVYDVCDDWRPTRDSYSVIGNSLRLVTREKITAGPESTSERFDEEPFLIVAGKTRKADNKSEVWLEVTN